MLASDDQLDLFLKAFTAGDLAVLLPSCDDVTPDATMIAAMEHHHIDVIGVRQRGEVVGWLCREDLVGKVMKPSIRDFEPESVVAETASLNDVVQKLSVRPWIFVRSLRQVAGLVRRCDLENAPMRMWLFGLVSITELRVTRLIEERFPAGAWQNLVSEGRLEKARELQQLRRRRNQDPSLLDCLQFADKGDIVARDDMLRSLTRFESRRAVDNFVKSLQDLRNNLAHSQDLSGDWKVILELAMNLHRIVLGPLPRSGKEPFEAVP